MFATPRMVEAENIVGRPTDERVFRCAGSALLLLGSTLG
jgi:hypothetical protein